MIHADGTGRLQIVREATDPLTHAYLKALGRRNGEEVAVNTSFNVAGPIAQTPDAGHRDAAALQGHGRGGDDRGGGRGLRDVAAGAGRGWRQPFSALVRGMEASGIRGISDHGSG